MSSDVTTCSPQQSRTQTAAVYQAFEKTRLEMTIKDINIDFVDEVEVKTSAKTAALEYTAGVSVVVKLLYDHYNSHEQLGYGISTSDSKSKSVLKAKQLAIDDAASRCFKMFGDIQKWHPYLMAKRKSNIP